ncbi:MAG: hypothetical protein VB064_10715 [Oscillospiraceae bacterium]|nr:hypothetical protein [Oscillospiraceae bacterium]
MNCDRGCNPCGICLSVLVAVIAATIVALLFAFDMIPSIVTVLWIMFGFAALMLIFLVVGLFASSLGWRSILGCCLCCNGSVLLAAIIGTIITTIIALSITLVITDIFAIVLIALATFFVALLVLEFIQLLSCLLNGVCCRCDD